MSPFALLNSLFAVVALTATMVQVGAIEPLPATGCKPLYENRAELLLHLVQFIYPTGKFNATCLGIACPALKSSPCPYLNGNSGPYDPEAVKKILTTFTSCLRSHASLCATPLKKIPICDTSVTAQAFLENPAYSGVIRLTPGSGTVSGIQLAKFAYNATNGEVTIEVTIGYHMEFEGTLGSSSFSGVKGQITLKAIVVDVVDPPNPTQFVRSSDVSTVDFHDKGPEKNANVQQILDQLNHKAEAGDHGLNYVGRFYGAMLQSAFDVAAANCPA